jgi:mRNA interferase MazF
VRVQDWAQAGLVLPSVVRLHKIATLGKDTVRRRLGALTARDWTEVQAAIKRLWALP